MASAAENILLQGFVINAATGADQALITQGFAGAAPPLPPGAGEPVLLLCGEWLASKSRADVHLRPGDRLPIVRLCLPDVEAEALEGATASLKIRDEQGATVTLAGATVVPSDRACEYAWGELPPAPGYWTAWFPVTFASGRVASYPHGGPFRILVSDW